MKNFMMGWSIKKRLYFLSGALMFNLLVVAGVKSWSQNKISNDLTELATVYMPALIKVGTADMYHDGLRGIAYRAMVFGESASAAEKKLIQKDFEEAALAIKENIVAAGNLAVTSEIKSLTANVLPDVDVYTEQVKAAVELGLAGQRTAAFGKLTEVQVSFEKLEKSLGALVEAVEVKSDKDKDLALAAASKGEVWSYLAISLGLILGCVFSWWIVRRINATFLSIIGQLTSESSDVSKASSQISSQSQQVSSATHEQASALQETAASIEEITAMVKKTSENSKKLESAAHQSSSSAERGKASVASMIKAIAAIRESNERVLKQVEAGNGKITEIVKVISEIGNKTKVINDIVFQTKLLSFNASVEAARAGEHGKGFAVVAEEVGNLAQMSGSAAKEISDMLASSIAHVENIVSETKRGVDGLVVEGRTKVESGIEVANQASKSLDEIVGQVSDVSSMVNEITTAIQEQTQGIHEISKAIGQLDTATQMNAKASKDAEMTSAELMARSVGLKDLVSHLENEVYGGHTTAVSESRGERSTTEPSGFTVRDSAVVPFKRPEQPKVQRAVGSVAVGGDVVPAEDDPRFEDV